MKHKALIIDDIGNERSIVHSALTAAGFAVTLVDTGADGHRLLSSHCYHLLVLDLRLPAITSTAVLQWLADKPRHRQLITVVLVAPPVPACLNRLATYVLCKPLHPDSFYEMAYLIQETIGRDDECVDA